MCVLRPSIVRTMQRTISERMQGKINGALDVATNVEVIGVKEPANVRAKGLSEEGGRVK